MNVFEPTGPTAARLRGRKQQLLTRFRVPSDDLPGSLAWTQLMRVYVDAIVSEAPQSR